MATLSKKWGLKGNDKLTITYIGSLSEDITISSTKNPSPNTDRSTVITIVSALNPLIRVQKTIWLRKLGWNP